MTQAELEALGAEWQERLGLTAWSIRFRLCHLREITRKDGGAEIEFSECRRRAVLSLVRFEERSHAPLDANDDEFLLVHELLHLVVCGFAPDEWSVAEEQAVNVLAGALLGLKREGKPCRS